MDTMRIPNFDDLVYERGYLEGVVEGLTIAGKPVTISRQEGWPYAVLAYGQDVPEVRGLIRTTVELQDIECAFLRGVNNVEQRLKDITNA